MTSLASLSITSNDGIIDVIGDIIDEVDGNVVINDFIGDIIDGDVIDGDRVTSSMVMFLLIIIRMRDYQISTHDIRHQ